MDTRNQRSDLELGSPIAGLAAYTLITTAKLNGVDPEAWLADVLRRINDHPASKLDELLRWNCEAELATLAA